MPSIIEAWLSSSDIIASSSVRRVSKRPPLASKHELYKIVSSKPRNSLSACSIDPHLLM